MKRLTLILLSAACLSGTAACKDVTRPEPTADATRFELSLKTVGAESGELRAADVVLRDARERIAAGIADDAPRGQFQAVLAELESHLTKERYADAGRALARARSLVASYEGPSAADVAAIGLALDQAAAALEGDVADRASRAGEAELR